MYMQNQIRNSDESYLFLISDLFDNFDDQRVYDILYKMAEQNIETHCILSMDQQGKSHYNKPLAQQLKFRHPLLFEFTRSIWRYTPKSIEQINDPLHSYSDISEK